MVIPRFGSFFIDHCRYNLVDLGDSLASLLFNAETMRLAECCEVLRKMRVGLGACRTGL